MTTSLQHDCGETYMIYFSFEEIRLSGRKKKASGIRTSCSTKTQTIKLNPDLKNTLVYVWIRKGQLYIFICISGTPLKLSCFTWCSGHQSVSFLLQYSVQGMTLPPESQIQHVSTHFSPDTIEPIFSLECQKCQQVLLGDTIICITH